MAELVELNKDAHRKLGVTANCELRFAETQHVLNIRAAELGKAACNFPVFFSKNPSTGTWMLSAVTSLEQGKNLFVEGDSWTATYKPTCLQTYPLFLMRSSQGDNAYCIGIDEQSSVFLTEGGEPIFEKNGEPTPHLSSVKAMLEADFDNDIQTHLFTQRLEELDLYKSVNISVFYASGNVQTITSLHTIDEDKLRSLSPEALKELQSRGYLVPLHAVLVSTHQVSLLVRKHNQIEGNTEIIQVKLEGARDIAGAEPGL